MKSAPPVPPILAIAFGILAVSTASIFIRYAQAQAPSFVIAAFRLTFASLLLAPVAIGRNRQELSRLSRREIGLALLSGFFLALHFAAWITSLQYTTVASSVVLVSTTPLWVALIAPFTIKESLNRFVLIGMGLALVGGALVGLSDSCTWLGARLVCPSITDFLHGQAFLGDLLALAGALMGSCYLLIGRRLRSQMSLISYVFVVYGMAAVVLISMVLITREKIFGYSAMTYSWFLLLAIVPQLLGHSTFNWALKYMSAAYVSISLLGEPIGSTILAYIFLKEAPTFLKVIGAILILIGILIASHRDVTQEIPPPDPVATHSSEVSQI